MPQTCGLVRKIVKNDKTPNRRWSLDILMVEDNPDIADSFRQLFELRGITVHVTDTAAEALQILQRIQPTIILVVQPTIILVDLILPDSSGYELPDMIREQYPNAAFPVIAFTATQKIRVIEDPEKDFDGYIFKPCPLDELIDRARQILEKKQAT